MWPVIGASQWPPATHLATARLTPIAVGIRQSQFGRCPGARRGDPRIAPRGLRRCRARRVPRQARRSDPDDPPLHPCRITGQQDCLAVCGERLTASGFNACLAHGPRLRREGPAATTSWACAVTDIRYIMQTSRCSTTAPCSLAVNRSVRAGRCPAAPSQPGARRVHGRSRGIAVRQDGPSLREPTPHDAHGRTGEGSHTYRRMPRPLPARGDGDHTWRDEGLDGFIIHGQQDPGDGGLTAQRRRGSRARRTLTVLV